MINLASTLEEAEKKYKQYKSLDPFHTIPPALLNSSDITKYVAATGMLYPFDDQDKKRWKPASYGLRLSGECAFWRPDSDKLIEIKLEKKENVFTLEKNTIAFLQVESKFQLPDYIAARFNLKIEHVYKGLLVGTGPLVDPGFQGHIYLPLHNLTSQEYQFRWQDIIIWVEFTKISPLKQWIPENESKDLVEYADAKYWDFDKKVDRTLKEYLDDAASGRPIRSSIPDSVREAKTTANEALTEAKLAFKRSDTITVAGVLGVLVAVLALWSIFAGFTQRIDGAREELWTLATGMAPYPEKMLVIESKLENLSNELEEMRMQIHSREYSQISKRVDELQAKIERLQEEILKYKNKRP